MLDGEPEKTRLHVEQSSCRGMMTSLCMFCALHDELTLDRYALAGAVHCAFLHVPGCAVKRLTVFSKSAISIAAIIEALFLICIRNLKRCAFRKPHIGTSRSVTRKTLKYSKVGMRCHSLYFSKLKLLHVYFAEQWSLEACGPERLLAGARQTDRQSYTVTYHD